MFSKDPPTGFRRDGYCRSGEEDSGNHSVAATVNQDFLDFTQKRGNNLQEAGVKAGMKWCLCAHRWQEAMKAAQEGQLSREAVPRVHLHASDKRALETVSYSDLKTYAAETEAGTNSGRQGGHQSTENSQSIVKESHSIGGDAPIDGPGAGKNQAKSGDQSTTSGNRG